MIYETHQKFLTHNFSNFIQLVCVESKSIISSPLVEISGSFALLFSLLLSICVCQLLADKQLVDSDYQ